MKMKRFIDRDEVKAVIERRATGAPIPKMYTNWPGEGLLDKYGQRYFDLQKEYPDDIFIAYYLEPGKTGSNNSNPEYRLGFKDYSKCAQHGTGHMVDLISDWSELDEFLEKFPSAYEPHVFDHVIEQVKEQKAQGRYCVGMWWGLFHEKFWTIRGMENLMMDYYDDMDSLKAMGAKFIEYYKGVIEQYAEAGCDAIFSSDDLGHQKGPMMSPAVFEELYYPLYKQFAEHVHKCGMHFILHSCGDNTMLMPYLVDAKVDVLHPLQAGCMDYKMMAEQYGEKISFLAGVDVQHLLPEGTKEEVIQGLESMINILYKDKGGLMIAAGNGIMYDTPLENIETMFETVSKYR